MDDERIEDERVEDPRRRPLEQLLLPQDVLEGDIYQRQVILCGNTRAGGSLEGLTSRVMRRGAEVNRFDPWGERCQEAVERAGSGAPVLF